MLSLSSINPGHGALRRWSLCAALVALPCRALAAPPAIPWGQLKGSADLLQSERETTAAVLRRERGYVGCKATVAQCLAVKPRVPGAWRLARYVVFLAGKGLDAEELSAALKQRRESVVPAKPSTIPLLGAPRLGPERAPVIIVEYADFRCRHCATVAPLLEGLQKRHPKQVAIYFKPYPLGPGPSVIAVRAALAAHQQGKFWRMKKLLFDNPDEHTPSGVVELAKRAKLDLAAFRAAFGDKALLQRIDMLKVEGLRLGIKGTPTLFVNGKLHRMPKDKRHLEERVADELELLAVQKKR